MSDTPNKQHLTTVPQALRAAKSGVQMSRLVLGSLPKVMRRQMAAALKYRRDLEAYVVEVKGEITLKDAHIIDEASQAEAHAAVCRWLMRNRLATMSVADMTRCSEQILKAKQARNKAFDALNLDAVPDDVIDALYSLRDQDTHAAEDPKTAPGDDVDKKPSQQPSDTHDEPPATPHPTSKEDIDEDW